MSAADKIEAARALIEPLAGHDDGPWASSHRGTRTDFRKGRDYHRVTTLRDAVDPDAEAVAHVAWRPRREANAALIAAAPALRDTVAALADLADAQAQEIARLRKMMQPEWFYSADGYDSEACRESVGEVLEEDFFWARSRTGQHVVEINVATRLPSIWAAVRFKCECDDPDECECDNEMIVTQHASEAEARAALGDAP